MKKDKSIYTQLEEKGAYLKQGLNDVLKTFNIPFVIKQLGTMISIHFSDKPVKDFESASSANNALFNKFFHAMLNRGVYLPPSAFETWFLSNALTQKDLDITIEAARESLQEVL